MSTQILRPVASVTVTDENDEALEVAADSARVVVDSGAVPYGSATVQVPLIAPETIEVIDPREDVRATVAIGEEGDTPRMFDLAVRSRRVDHKAKRIEMQLATDEALLQDYAPLVDDAAPRQYESSLRAVVNYVLGVVIPGAELEAALTDADVTAYWPVTNAVWNTVADTTTAFLLGTGSDEVGTDPPAVQPPVVGSALVWWHASGVGPSYLHVVGTARVNPGDSWTGSVYFAADQPGSNAWAIVRYRDASDNIIGDVYSPPVAPVPGVWVRAVAVSEAPVGAVQVELLLRGDATSANRFFRVDAPMLTDTAEAVPVFHGATPDDAHYSYAYQGDPLATASTRTPVIERRPELFTWPAGVSAWEFLQPLTAVAGLRLYCDETRAWRLIDPAEFASPGRVTLSPLNSTEGRDEISRENADIYCTGVVVKYSWTDPTGTAKTATDTAGTAGRVFIVELNRPYPGPGVAAAILARRQGQGRTQDVTALAVWGAQPGQEASISLPGTVEQIGRVASIEWELPAGLMRVGTTGLVDVPPEAWLALDPGESWLDSPIGESWTDEVI